MSDLDEYAKRVTQHLVDDGRIMEAGWITYKLHCIPVNAPEVQLQATRESFFAGAQHLFSTILTMLDGSQADESRMNQINKELRDFYVELCKKQGIPTR